MTETAHISPETFALGNFAFRLKSRSQAVLDGARKLYLSTCSDSQYHVFDLDLVVQDTDEERANRLRALTTDAYRYHSGHLYIDGCALVTEHSELVLLAGASHAGKTTLTVATVEKLGWKILSEDLVLIEPSLAGVVPFTNPLSVRPGSLKLIADATGMTPPNLYLDRWLARDEMFYAGPLRKPKFNHSIILHADSDNQTFRNSTATPHEFLRRLLPLSNALHLDNGLDLLGHCLDESQCSIVYGGTVKDRLELLKELTAPGVPRRDSHELSTDAHELSKNAVQGNSR